MLKIRIFFLSSILISFIYSHSLLCQTELVSDINPGPANSGIYCDFNFTWNQDCAITLGETIIFIAENEEFGRELYAINDGTVELLADIYVGESDSDPEFLTLFNNHVYFIAEDGDETEVWKTDGTKIGTKVAFDLGNNAGRGNYVGFLVNNDILYLEYKASIYAYDGTEVTEIEHNTLTVSGESQFGSRGWTTYKDGIAVLDIESSSWDMLYIHDNRVDILFTYPMNAFSTSAYGLAEFDGGLIFNFESSDEEIEGRYLFEESTGTYTKQSDELAVRVISVNNKSAVVITSDEILLYDSQNQTGKQIVGNTPNLSQGEDWKRNITNQYLAFQSLGGTFNDDNISLLDSDDGSVMTIYSGDNLSEMVTLNNNIFFFGESTNDIFNQSLFRYEIESEILSEIIEIIDPPFNSDLYPIGFQDGYIYYFGNLDDAFGIEIYRSEVGINTSTNNISTIESLSLEKLSQNVFKVTSESDDDIIVDIYNTNGQRLQHEIIDKNGIINVNYVGLLYITIRQSTYHKTFKRLIVE